MAHFRRQLSSPAPTNPSQGESPVDPAFYHGGDRRSMPSPSSPSPLPTSDEGYPSWLPKRPPPPAPRSTYHSSNANMWGADPGPSEPPVFSAGRKPTPRSVRIVSLQDEFGRREPTEQTRISSAAHPHGHHRVWSRATPTGVSPGPTVFSPTLIDGSRIVGPPRPRFRASGLHLELLRNPSWKSRLHFFLFPLFVFAHIPLQTFFDFNAVFILIQIALFPNPIASGVPGSGRNWALGAAAYVACWAVWILGVFIGYELIYSFYRRWRYRRPLMLPLYLSSPAFNLVSMTSYSNFCFMQHIRNSAFPYVNQHSALPSSESSLRDGLAETCYFYSQNLPTVSLLLPRAGLALALLLSFWSPEQLPGELTLSDFDASVGRRDGTFFDQNEGTLSGYAKGVLLANVAWTGWRILVLLMSWVGVWIFSGYGCAGICGPRFRWEEEDAEKTFSIYSEKSIDEAGESSLPWTWKECTHLRIQEAYDFCLTTRPPRTVAGADPAGAGVGVGARNKGKEPSEVPFLPRQEDIGAGGFEGMEQVLAAVGLGSPGPVHHARRGMLSQDLFESPKDEDRERELPVRGDIEEVPAVERKASTEVSVIPRVERTPEKDEGPLATGGPLLAAPYPFTGFGGNNGERKSSDSPKSEQIPFPPSPGIHPEETDEVDEDEEEEEGEGEEEEDLTGSRRELGYVNEDEEESSAEPRTSNSFSNSGRASNSLSSLGQPIPSRYPFQFRYPGRGASVASSSGHTGTGTNHSRGTPQSKSTSTRNSRSTRSTGNVESSSDSHSPRSRAGNSSSAPSPVVGIPMPPRHPGSTTGNAAQRRQRSGTVPIPASPTPPGPLPLSYPPSLRPRARTRTESDRSTGILYESDIEEEPVGRLELGLDEPSEGRRTPSRTGQTDSPDLEALEQDDSVGLLSSAPSPKSSSGGLRARAGSIVSLTRRANDSRSRHNSSGSGSGSRSDSNSRHHSTHSNAGGPTASAVSLALARGELMRQRTQSLIHSIGSASRSSIELVTGSGNRRSRAQSVVRLEDYEEAGMSSPSSPYFSEEGGLSSPENHTFGQPSAPLARRLIERQQIREVHQQREGVRSLERSRSHSGGESEVGHEHEEREVEIETDKEYDGQFGDEDLTMSQPGSILAGSGSASPKSSQSGGRGRSRPESPRTRVISTVSRTAPSERTISLAVDPASHQPTVSISPPPTQPVPTPSGSAHPTRPVAPGRTSTAFFSFGPGDSGSEPELISTAAPSFVTAPPTVEEQTESSGATPSSWGNMGHYMEGREGRPM